MPRLATSAYATALLVGLAASHAAAQQGVGAKYGARDPRTCPNRTAPTSGAITPALAAKYVACEEEHEYSRSLYLVDKMQVQVGAPRPYEARADGHLSEIDPAQPVYRIRGSYVRYSCDPPQAATTGPYGGPSTVGHNCRITDQPHAEGACYKTRFGDWQCYMKDYDNTLTTIAKAVPPPT